MADFGKSISDWLYSCRPSQTSFCIQNHPTTNIPTRKISVHACYAYDQMKQVQDLGTTFALASRGVEDYAYLVALDSSGEPMNDVQVRPGISLPLLVKFVILHHPS